MNSTEQRAYFIALARVKGIGPVRLRTLLAFFPSAADIWAASQADLQSSGLDNRSIHAVLEARTHSEPIKEYDGILNSGIGILTWDEPTYPRLLKQITDPPPVLYIRGTLKDEDAWSIGIVGTRHVTAYGRTVSEMFARDLANSHITVVSGLARGVDGCAHQAALKAGGRTIAVLGCGVDMVYPPEHKKLAHEIVENGALVSDYPPGTQPESANFPPRNRIISGLSLGVVVVEAGEPSGALITSEFAIELGREVFSVPGNILSRTSKGTNKLIQKGAKLVTCIADILEELNISMVSDYIATQESAPENDTEKAVMSLLSHEPTLTDDLVNALKLPTEVVTGTLAMMELKGMIRQANGTSYVLARESRSAYG